MFKCFQVLIAFFVLLGVSASSFAQRDPLIIGWPEHDQFLGCLVCNEYSSQSICNGFGPYGNEFTSKGMFNEFSGFGNEFSSSSPDNEFSSSTSVPVVVDRDSNIYGYFRITEMRPDAVVFASDLKKMYEYADGDLGKVRVKLCKTLGYS